MLFNYIFIIFFCISSADEHDHRYKDNEEVVLWMNTVGPFHNRQETYPFFSLPFCRGPKEHIGHYHETLGEALLGVELEFSGIDIKFKNDSPTKTYCELTYHKEEIDKLKYAIENQYWFQMYMDNLPIWKTVGGIDKDEYFIWTQKFFEIEYNKDQIVGITVSSGNKVVLSEGQTVSFSYKVKWIESSVDFNNRYDRYLDVEFFEHKIHWFSIFNSFFMVLFLVALVAIILMRTLRKDYARYNKEVEANDLENDFGNEYGWKQIHGDVFRFIPNPTLFSCFIGNGIQICSVALIVSSLASFGKMYMERGSLMSVAIFVITITSPINGFVGGSLYSKLKGPRWIRQFIYSSLLMPICIGVVCFFVNNTALYYQSSRSIPFLTIISLLAIIILVVIPLNLIGTLLGRNLLGQSNNPCRINTVPRPIPRKKWYLEPLVLALLGGLLPFGSIFIEMYFIFTSFWAYKIYFVFGFAFLVLIMLLLVTACVSIVGVYFILNAEDYRWQWTSMMIGSSVGFYVYLYSIYYFLFKTKMYGLFQTTFFFGTMALFCMSISLMCGAIAFLATSLFVKKIYSTVKVD